MLMGLALRLALYSVLIALALKLLVWWLEPRMAFYPTRGVQETPAAAGLSFADLRVPTPDGETLHGWWLEHPSPRAQVIFFHGNGGNLSLWLSLLVDMRRRGFSVLAIDYRGYGASTGSPTERGLYRDADATLSLFAEKLRQKPVPVIYWGRSIGSSMAAYAATRVAPNALVLDSPFPEVGAILRGNPVMMFLHVFSSYSFPTSRFLEKYDGPLLVVHGDADSIVPFSAGRRVFERARSARKTFAVMPGADHNDLDAVDSKAYWKAIDAFVDGLRESRTAGV
jgi:alpha-beta hydrolase superfamily lysophospholipase